MEVAIGMSARKDFLLVDVFQAFAHPVEGLEQIPPREKLAHSLPAKITITGELPMGFHYNRLESP